MMKKIIALSSIAFSINAYSVVNCPAAKLVHIQAQTNAILYQQEGQPFHRLGKPGGPGVSEMYSALLSAQASGKTVTIRYPDGYDCSVATNALMVRTNP